MPDASLFFDQVVSDLQAFQGDAGDILDYVLPAQHHAVQKVLTEVQVMKPTDPADHDWPKLHQRHFASLSLRRGSLALHASTAASPWAPRLSARCAEQLVLAQKLHGHGVTVDVGQSINRMRVAPVRRIGDRDLVLHPSLTTSTISWLGGDRQRLLLGEDKLLIQGIPIGLMSQSHLDSFSNSMKGEIAANAWPMTIMLAIMFSVITRAPWMDESQVDSDELGCAMSLVRSSQQLAPADEVASGDESDGTSNEMAASGDESDGVDSVNSSMCQDSWRPPTYSSFVQSHPETRNALLAAAMLDATRDATMNAQRDDGVLTTMEEQEISEEEGTPKQETTKEEGTPEQETAEEESMPKRETGSPNRIESQLSAMETDLINILDEPSQPQTSSGSGSDPMASSSTAWEFPWDNRYELSQAEKDQREIFRGLQKPVMDDEISENSGDEEGEEDADGEDKGEEEDGESKAKSKAKSKATSKEVKKMSKAKRKPRRKAKSG